MSKESLKKFWEGKRDNFNNKHQAMQSRLYFIAMIVLVTLMIILMYLINNARAT